MFISTYRRCGTDRMKLCYSCIECWVQNCFANRAIISNIVEKQGNMRGENQVFRILMKGIGYGTWAAATKATNKQK
jgi:hypothetical protein